MTNDPNRSEHFDSPPMQGHEPVQGPHITEDLPGVDPRIAALKKEPLMHTNPKQDIEMTATEAKTPQYGSLTNLIDRLEHTYSYLAGLHSNMVELNTKLGGPVPREDDKNDPDKSDNCLGIAHALVTDIERRLQSLDKEIKRLHHNIGE